MVRPTVQEPQSSFVKVRCTTCKNEQILFGSASSVVTCLVSDKELARPTGGNAEILAQVLEVLE